MATSTSTPAAGGFFSKILSGVENFFSKIVKGAPAVVADVDKVLETAAQVALNATNALKDFAASPEGKTIESVLETVVPAQWVNTVINALPLIITAEQWAVQEFNKTPAQVVHDGLTYAVNAIPDVKTSKFTVLYAHLNTLIGNIQGVNIPIQGGLTQAPTVYAMAKEATA